MTDTSNKTRQSCTVFDTPETDAVLKQFEHHLPNWLASEIMAAVARRLERERDEWKAAHDNQAKLKRIISDRPDLKERAKLVAELIKERDEWKEVAEGRLLGAIKERDEALFDLDFRRDLFKLQESQLNEIRKRLAEARKRVGWLAGRPQQTCC
jgi:hypothetical protein